MTNSSNAPCLLDLYHMQCKHDTVEDPATLWNYGFKDQSAQTAIDYTKYYGTNPLDSVGVTTYWRCRDIVHITLNPGQVHVERFDLDINYAMSNYLLNANEQSDLYMKDITRTVLFVAKGSPADNAGGVIATTPTNIIIVGTQRIEFKYIQDEDTNYSYGTLGNTLSGTVPIAYNQGSGASNTAVSI